VRAVAPSRTATDPVCGIALGEKGFPCVLKRLDLEPECNRNLVPDLERRIVAAVQIVVPVELECTAEHPGNPLRITDELSIVAVAARVERR